MFSANRLLNGLIVTGNKINITWKILFEDLIYFIYFQDHLTKHELKMNYLYIILDGNSSLEVVNLLILLSQKYSFIKIRKSENSMNNVDFESNFSITNNLMSDYELKKSSMCLLIGTNTRYESSSLNLKLRKRFLKGNFKMFTLNSYIDVTIPSTQLGLNVTALSSIVEGNNKVCQIFVKSRTNPIIITNIKCYKNSYQFFNLEKKFKANLKNYHLNWDNFNVIGSQLNDSGIHYLNYFKTFSEIDIKNSTGLYFINIKQANNLNFKKLINLKLLKYLQIQNYFFKFLLDQSGGQNMTNHYLKKYNLSNYYNLPNKVFFETDGTYLNSERHFKYNFKIINSTNSQSKDDWDILRKLTFYLNNLNYISYTKDNFKLSLQLTINTRYKQ
jgi:NADH dehydrogenase/NADH:ubiquinone oxidoreductase subunit G